MVPRNTLSALNKHENSFPKAGHIHYQEAIASGQTHITGNRSGLGTALRSLTLTAVSDHGGDSVFRLWQVLPWVIR